MTNPQVFLVLGTGVSHWGKRVQLRGIEAHDVGVAASILGYGYITGLLARCRTGAALPVPCGSCDRDATLRGGMAANGFVWYDTGQAHIVTDAHFYRCGAASGDGGGDDSGGCGGTCLDTSAVWGFLTHSDEHVPEAMQATAQISYEQSGVTFRFVNHVTDSGLSLSNGMAVRDGGDTPTLASHLTRTLPEPARARLISTAPD